LVDETKDCNDMHKIFLVFPWEKMDMLKMFLSGSLILRISGTSLVTLGGHTGWMANCSAALSCTSNPTIPWGS
jgi:hypothetical protein